MPQLRLFVEHRIGSELYFFSLPYVECMTPWWLKGRADKKLEFQNQARLSEVRL